MRTIALCLLFVGFNGDDIRARFGCEPGRVEVGEPFALVLELSHPAGVDVFDLGRVELELDDSWVVLNLVRHPSEPDPADTARRITRRVWTVASLEPGERRLAESLTPLVADERIRSVDVGAAMVEVVGLLGPGEDAPRPLRGFPPGFGSGPETAASPWRWAALALAALLWAAVGAWVWRWLRRSRARRGASGPAPLERLELLGDERPGDVDALRRQHYELTQLVRDAMDQRLGSELAGLTDAEWMRAVQARPNLPAGLKTELAAVLERAEAVKYGRAIPTSWAVDETLGHARRALEHAGASEEPR